MKELLSIRSELLAFLETRLGSQQLAEDVLQAAFVRCIEKRATLRRDENIIPWFYALLGNSLVDVGRRRAAEWRVLEVFGREADLHSTPESPLHPCPCIARLLDQLKPEYRRALRIVDVDGQSVAELARRERISANNASVRLHRARRALARRVRAVCGPCADLKCVDCSCPSPAADAGKTTSRSSLSKIVREGGGVRHYPRALNGGSLGKVGTRA
jgi:RNA polymerase sigma-70 factor (ECF subfamily)